MGQVKNHFWNEIEHNAYVQEYPEVYDHCEEDVVDLDRALDRAMNYSDEVSVSQYDELVIIMRKLVSHVSSLSEKRWKQ